MDFLRSVSHVLLCCGFSLMIFYTATKLLEIHSLNWNVGVIMGLRHVFS